MDYRSTPSVQIDLDIAEQNIRSALEALSRHGIAHRPHIKAHKSTYLALMQTALGCKGITCAKLGEAEVMADAGIDDILLAYPLIGEDKLSRYRLLLEREMTIRTIINSVPGAKGLSLLGNAMGKPVSVLVELDGGLNRGGIKPGDVEGFVREVMPMHGISIEGVCCYGGDIYACKTMDEIRVRAAKERDDILAAARCMQKLGLSPHVLSGGSSFSLLCPEELHGLTEVRAGNYIFNDNALLSIGVIGLDACAMRVLATVVSRPDENTAIVDAGSKTLTTDTVWSRPGYGYVPEEPGAVIYKLNEEHGFVRHEKPLNWQIGETITIIPNHACTVPNLCDEIYGMRGGRLAIPISIEARGKNR